jgi:cell division protein FtsW
METISIGAWLRQNLKGDRQIWWIIGALCTISILAVYSASGAEGVHEIPEKKLLKHVFHLCIALLFIFILHRLDYTYYARWSQIGVILSIPLLIWAKVGGVEINEAHRWVQIGFVQFQPSDMAKVCLIAYLATMLARRQRIDFRDNPFYSFWLMVIWCVIICGLIGMSNASNGALLLLTCFVVMYIGRVPVRYLSLLVVLGTVFLALGLIFGKERIKTVNTRVNNFVISWQTGKPDYQMEQAYKAIANGGVFGKGPGNSHQRNLLPFCYADFIYPIIVEEYGLWGGAVVIILFLWLLYRGMKILSRAERALGGLLATGLCTSIVLQALFNMAITVELFPTTGLTLPFISMGGTSLTFTGIALGIVLSVSRGGVDDTKI